VGTITGATKLILRGTLLVTLVLAAGCSRTGILRLAGAVSYARIYASDSGLLWGQLASCLTSPLTLRGTAARAMLLDMQSGLARGERVARVPFCLQGRQSCGAAALTSVLRFYGSPVELRDVASAVVIPALGGTLFVDMVSYPRAKGLWSEQYRGGAELLCTHLAAGRPVICLLGSGVPCTAGHYITVTACAPGRGVVCHNGYEPDHFMSWREFDTLWKASRHWMLVVCPPEDVDWEVSSDPVEKDEFGLLLHLRGGLRRALAQYEAALVKETDAGEKARITHNIGLAQFALGRLDAARVSFEKALELRPGFPEAANALALTYATLRVKLDEAERLVRSTLASDRADDALYLDTLGFVLHQEGRDREAREALESALGKAGEADTELLADIRYHLALTSAPGAKAREADLRKAAELAPQSLSGREAAALLESLKQNERKSP
jgi:tetratricopeptide (TPR) repeat protein